jgi:hypothetical protein
MEMTRRIVGAAALVLLAAACSRTVSGPTPKEAAGGLLVTGLGRVEVRPNILED